MYKLRVDKAHRYEEIVIPKSDKGQQAILSFSSSYEPLPRVFAKPRAPSPPFPRYRNTTSHHIPQLPPDTAGEMAGRQAVQAVKRERGFSEENNTRAGFPSAKRRQLTPVVGDCLKEEGGIDQAEVYEEGNYGQSHAVVKAEIH